MHVVGRMKKSVLNQSQREEQARLAAGVPMQFYGTRPIAARA
jgi:hypothetical protein